jgi:ABC-type multidrug transport system fused ATPase/permease subunit
MLLIAVAGLEVYGAVIMANVINAVINKHLSKFYTQMIFWLLIWSIIIIIRYSLSIFETKFEQSIANKIRADIVETISHESYQEYNSSDNSKFVSWMNNDTQQIVDKGITYLYIVVEAISSIILSLITLWKYNIWIMLASIFLAFITLFLPKILNNKLAKTSSELSTENEKFVALSSNLLSNFNMLFSFNALSLMKEKISEESKKIEIGLCKSSKSLRWYCSLRISM